MATTHNAPKSFRMPTPTEILNHPLLDRLRRLDPQAVKFFPAPRHVDPGLGWLGLLLDAKLNDSCYPHCTPANCRTFAHTGGNGVHFSLLVQEGSITERSPVIMTVPAAGGLSFVVGENLHDFLCLGRFRGYFGLEQLAYNAERTQEAYLNKNFEWYPLETPDEVELEKHKQRVLDWLATELDLQPWTDVSRFAALHERFYHLLAEPAESYF